MYKTMKLFHRIMKRGDLCNHISYATTKMQKNGNIKPSVDCFNPIIDSLCKERRVDEAFELFQDMVNQHIQPDVVIYTALFHGFCKSSRVEEIKKFLNDMIDCRISPDVYAYNALINCLCNERGVDEALVLFQDMVNQPNVVTYTALFHGFYKSGCVEEAKKFVNDMIECGIAPDVYTYNALIDSRCKEDKTTEAISLLS